MPDTLRSAIEALAKEWGEADDKYHNPTVQEHEAARRLRAILATHPEEPLREALKNRLDEANEVIDLLRIGADNETDTVIDCMEAVLLIDAFDAALSHESAPTKPVIEDRSREIAFTDDEPAEPCPCCDGTGLRLSDEGEYVCTYCEGTGKEPAKPAESKRIDLDAGIADGSIQVGEHWRKMNKKADPPAPKRWRCKKCGKLIKNRDRIIPTKPLQHQVGNGRKSHFCGPVDEVTP